MVQIRCGEGCPVSSSSSECWSSRLRIHTPILGKHLQFATGCTLAQTHSSKFYPLCLHLINFFWVMDVLSQKIRMCFILLALLNAVGISFAVKRTYVRRSGKLMSSPALSWSSDILFKYLLCSLVFVSLWCSPIHPIKTFQHCYV